MIGVIEIGRIHAIWVLSGVLLWFFLGLYDYKKREKSLAQFAKQSLLKELLVGPSTSVRLWQKGLLGFAWCFLSLSLMDPKALDEEKVISLKTDGSTLEKLLDQEPLQKVKRRKKMHDVYFLLDASQSMLLEDTRIKKSRLEFAKEIIDETISQLEGQNVSLYAFTSQVTPLVPPTLDYLFFRLFLKRVGVNEGDVAGTDLFELFDYLVREKGEKGVHKSIILLTDGGDTRIEGLSLDARTKEIEALLARVRQLQEEGVHFTLIGLGSLDGRVIPSLTFNDQPVVSALDVDLLKQIAEKVEGRFFLANDSSSYALASHLSSEIIKNTTFEEEEIWAEAIEKEGQNLPQYYYKYYFQIPLLIALLALFFEMALPLWRRETFQRVKI